MSPRPYDIYVAVIPWGYCNDRRPCIIVEACSDGMLFVVPISSQMDLLKGGRQHFLIQEGHRDFTTTGLHRTSYADLDMHMQIRIGALVKKIGCLKGELATEFDKVL